MDRLSKKIKSIPIPIFFIILALIFIVIANFLSTLTSNIFTDMESELYEKYDSLYIKNQSTSDGVLYTTEFDIRDLSDEDLDKYNLIHFVYKYYYAFWYTICITICAFLFYYIKLRTPIKKLEVATEKIANNDLDFEIVADSNDELGMLCQATEKMRASLYDNNKKMWRMVEDKKTVNSALSHDIRTPITILKGNTEMLLRYIPSKKIDEKKTLDMLEGMKSNIVRLEDFLSNMSTIGKIEQIEPKYKKVNTKQLLEDIKKNTKTLSETKNINFIFRSDITKEIVLLDENIIHEVYNNIVNNAIRYAQDKIEVNIYDKNNMLSFEVTDDGKGFSEKALREATHLYFKEGAEQSHFGLGLYISKLLCEKHNGSIKISNEKIGAKVKFSFSYKILKS